MIVSPHDPQSLQEIVFCAQAFPGTRLSPLNGGHSFASFGLGGLDGAVVIRMKNFKNLRMLQPVQNTPIVQVGAGILIRELIDYLLKNGGLGFPHARCTEVKCFFYSTEFSYFFFVEISWYSS